MLRISCLALLAVASIASADSDGGILGARYLALSPDGTRLAFSYQGDLWVAPSSGGQATRLTNHVEMDIRPVWSPDGSQIAFASNRFGNNDAFVIPVNGGGSVRRLTWWSGSDLPVDWSPDGKSVIIDTTREDGYGGFYAVDVADLKTHKLFVDFRDTSEAQISGDGKSLLITRSGFPYIRPRYEGSAAAETLIVDLATGKKSSIETDRYQNLWPKYAPDGKSIFCVTVGEKTPSAASMNKPLAKFTDSAERTPNVYQYTGGSRKRITSMVGGAGTRWLTVAKKAPVMMFEFNGKLYRKDLSKSSAPATISVTISADDKTSQEERLTLKDGAAGASLSPNGETFVFEVRGELWSVPTKKVKGPNADDATQMTTWEGMDANPTWSRDGKTVFFLSDRNGVSNIYSMGLGDGTAKQLTQFASDVTSIKLIPGSNDISFTVPSTGGGVFRLDPATGKQTRLMEHAKTYVGGLEDGYTWSPDGRYIAYSDVLLRSGYYFWDSGSNLYIFDTVTGRHENVTKLNANHRTPAFSSDGRYLYFNSNREGNGLYALSLQKDLARRTEAELKYEKPKSAVKVEIDWDNISDRVKKISGVDAVLPASDAENGDIYAVSNGDVWKFSYDGETASQISTGGGIWYFEFSQDGKLLTIVKNGVPGTIDIRKPNNPLTLTTFAADWTRDLRKERAAALQQLYRIYKENFYDGNMHGRDWLDIRNRYESLLSSVGHPQEMATILGMMTGELESSHSETGWSPNIRSVNSAHLGLTFDYSYQGPGIKVAAVPKRTPGSYVKTQILPGEIIKTVNGKSVSLTEELYHGPLSNIVGKDVTLEVADAAGKTRNVKFRAMNLGDYFGIRSENEIEWRKSLVEAASGGKVSYVYISGMGGGNFDRFQRDFWQAVQDKKAMIIDVRGNGGGNISDRLIDMLERRPHSYYQNRDQDPQLAPGQAPNMPMVVMCDETSFSNAEMFPYAMRARGLAKLVGKQTPGYVIWTVGLDLVDGTGARLPGSGVFRLDGTPLENNGQKVDFELDYPSEDYFAGRDPQLQKAIEVLLKASQ